MAIDALLPVGGELIMVVAGAIAAGAVGGEPHFFGSTLSGGAEIYFALATAGTLGYLTGSLAGWAVFLGRLTPLVRSFVSIPSGLFGEPLRRYTLLTLAGSAIWCFFFAGLGWALGSGYKNVDHVTHVIEALIVIALIGFAVYLLRRRSLTRR